MFKKTMLRVVKCLPLPLKKFVFTAKLFFLHPFLIKALGKQFTAKQTIAVISFPRSGSSWVGSILGKGSSVRYLREPVTTQYMQKVAGRVSVFEQQSSTHWPEYLSYINKVLQGLPVLTHSVVKHPTQWQQPQLAKTLLIKEVNPLVIEQFVGKVNQVIYLVRHPFSVAKSYQALGWMSARFFEKKFAQDELALIYANEPSLSRKSFWYNFGYMLGWIEGYVKHTRKECNDTGFLTIKYEELCQNPLGEFTSLFKQCDLPFEQAIKNQLVASLAKNNSTKLGDFSLARKQQDVAFVSISEADKDNYTDVMDAYYKGFVDYNMSHNVTHYGMSVEAEYVNDSGYIRVVE
jgi:hypothetical protein